MTVRLGTLLRCRSTHKTADETTHEKQVSSGKERKQPSVTVVSLTAMQCKETSELQTVEYDYVAAGIREETKRALERKRENSPSVNICSRNQEWL